MTMQEMYEGIQKQQAEQTAAAEAARKANVNRFVELWLSLGPDVMKLDGTRHDAELAEARGLAMARWFGLKNMESQIVRETQALAGRPKDRPARHDDDRLPDRTIEKQNAEWLDQTRYLRDSLEALKAEAKAERTLLEGYIVKSKK